MSLTDLSAPHAAELGLDSPLVMRALAATQAAAVAAARCAGRGDAMAADAAATDAMRGQLASAPGSGTIVTGEGEKDDAPMLAGGEVIGIGDGPAFDIAVDPLECTDLCARGLPGALATIALAPADTLWSPGPAYYMDKLVVGPAAAGAARLGDGPEAIVVRVAALLRKRVSALRVAVLDKPRHVGLVAQLRELGVRVTTPTAGDVGAALSALLPDGEHDLLLGIGGTPEGVMTACAVRALGGDMQGRVAPQRDDERDRVLNARMSLDRVLERDELAGADGAFIATGVTGGALLAAPRPTHRGSVVTESLVIAGGVVRRITQTTSQED